MQLSEVPDYIAVAETGYHSPSDHAFLTGIYDREDFSLVRCALDQTNLRPLNVNWGNYGLVIEFDNNLDLALFTLAYDGPLPD